MESERSTFPIGVNAVVMRDNSILLGLRKNSHGSGTWSLPGGHLELGESVVDAVARELLEETGLRPRRFVFSAVVNNVDNSRHYIQFAFLAEEVTGEPEVKEPDLCESWQWFPAQQLPENLFPPHKQLIVSALKGDHYTES
ncbi:MAG: NUDIX domain-containing protein [Patescibacteria group bacterium]|jgi:8-oxo-dGTP diphosphatase